MELSALAPTIIDRLLVLETKAAHAYNRTITHRLQPQLSRTIYRNYSALGLLRQAPSRSRAPATPLLVTSARPAAPPFVTSAKPDTLFVTF
jgi:hypothetical protein